MAPAVTILVPDNIPIWGEVTMLVLPETNFCPECGGIVSPEQTCVDYYRACMAKEFTDAGYGAVHHLTVPAYMLQHPSQLSRQGWLEMRKTLVKFVVEGKSIPEMRSQARKPLDSGRRDFSFGKGEPMDLSSVVWSRTIADVCLDDATVYCADIIGWARSVIEDTETNVQLKSSDLSDE